MNSNPTNKTTPSSDPEIEKSREEAVAILIEAAKADPSRFARATADCITNLEAMIGGKDIFVDLFVDHLMAGFYYDAGVDAFVE